MLHMYMYDFPSQVLFFIFPPSVTYAFHHCLHFLSNSLVRVLQKKSV